MDTAPQPFAPPRELHDLDHVVQFYEHDAFLIEALRVFVAEGLRSGQACVVVATPEHRAGLEEALSASGIPFAAAQRDGRFVSLDAAALLGDFMVDNVPDPRRFAAAVSPTLDRARQNGSAVRVFGEMVALLWAEGNVTGAIELEEQWNALAQSRSFRLFCAYPMGDVGPSNAEPFRRICDTHSLVLPSESYASEAPFIDLVVERLLSEEDTVTLTRRLHLPANLRSGRSARIFVRDTLFEWQCAQVLDDVLLLTTELVNNAVVHAGSSVDLRLVATPSRVRVEVTDLGDGGLHLRHASLEDTRGRGLALVASVARAWGSETLAEHGKRVWFELAR